MAKRENNLGSDPIGKLLLRLALPTVTAQLVNALYNIVDRMYIGHMEGVGDLALTGLGVCFPVIMFVSAISALVGMGGASRAVVRMGEGKQDTANAILGNCTALLILLSILVTVAFQIVREPMLLLFGATENTIGYATEYLVVYLWGTIFVEISLGLNYFITSQGFSTISMATVLIGAVINIVLDPIFIFGFGMGVQGAAWATILSQAVSCVWVLAFLRGKNSFLRLKAHNMRLRLRVIAPCLALGVSPFIMQMTESAIAVCFNTSLFKYGGDMAVGAMTVLVSVMQFSMLPMMGLTQGAQPIISYNYGAHNADRVSRTFRLLVTSSLVYSASLWALCMTLPQALVYIFVDDAALAAYTQWCLRLYMCGSVFFGAQIACQQTFIALGKAGMSVFLALLRKVLLLIPLVYVLPLIITQNQVAAVLLAEPVADLTAVTVTVSCFAVSFRRVLRNLRRPEA